MYIHVEIHHWTDNKIELIADKDQNNTYVFTNFRINLYQEIYAIKRLSIFR